MSSRLFIASAALTAVVGASAFVAVSTANTNHHVAGSAAVPGAGASHGASATSAIVAAHANQRVAQWSQNGVVSAALPGASASSAFSAAAAGPTSSTPTLVSVRGGAHVLAQGAQKAVPVAVNEDQAMQAIFKGGMWLPNASGGREYAKYDHHLIHDGDWTWVGKVQTTHGLQSAVITFGKDAVYGRIPQASGQPLRLVTAGGQKLLVQTDGDKMAASALNRQLYARQDFKIPSHKAESSKVHAASAAATRTVSPSAQVATSASATGGATIDVMVAYTNGFASAEGGTSAALTRINNLVDVTNQAYADSGVSQRIRLVHTMAVSYTDTNDNTMALDDLTGNDGNGNSVPIPSALQGIASARTQYGADLVVLLRHFNNAGNNGCGVGWLIGGGEQQIVPSQDNAFGYSVVQDGSDGGYFCLDSTFAHELGHNMGSAHDRANADQPGAYSYSYGYIGNGADGFSTIMAYGKATQTPLDLFSNPNISKCQNTPCGVADSSTSSADNVHSLNNTASLIAQFEATKVTQPVLQAHNDVNGDGKSDILFNNPGTGGFVYWIMNGARFVSYRGFTVGTGYSPVGTGDLNGDGNADILWSDGITLYAWISNGTGSYTNSAVRAFPSGGWKIIGVGDVNGDGKADILWHNPNDNQFIYWLMNGATVVNFHEVNVTPGFTAIGQGDFNGDGLADVAWKDATGHVYIWIGNGTSFTQYQSNAGFDPSWTPAGIGDVDGNGDSDLFWYQPSSGNVQYWLMHSATVVGYKVFNTGQGYTFAGVGDFDGDGQADILWTRNNVLSMWLHYNPYSYYGVTVQSYASGWNVLP